MLRSIQVYDGILVRKSLLDVGNIPYEGNIGKSPDIMPAGTERDRDPQGTYGNTRSYRRYENQDLMYNEANYIYVRGKNLSQSKVDGQVYLYWAKTEELNSPATWRDNLIKCLDGNDFDTVTAYVEGDIVVSPRGFLWDPKPPAVGQSWSLIGVIASEGNPNPVPDLPDSFEFEDWLREQGGVSWFQFPPYRPDIPTIEADNEFNLTGYKQNVRFQIATEGIPVGSTVSFEGSLPDANGNPIRLEKTEVTTDPYFRSVNLPLDGLWDGRVSYTVDVKGQTPLPNNKVSMTASITQQSSSGPSKEVEVAGYTTQIFVPDPEETT